MDKNNQSEKMAVISGKIRKNITMDSLEIQEVFDEESKKFTTDVGMSEAYIKGMAAGKLRGYMEIGLKLVELFDEIEKETGMTFEELKLLKQYSEE